MTNEINLNDPKSSETVYLACRTKSPAEFVGRIFRIDPSIKLGQLMNIVGRHFDLTPKEYSQVEEDFVKFSRLKKALVGSLKNGSKNPEGFMEKFFEVSPSGGMILASRLVSEAYGLSTETAKALSSKFSTLAYTKLAGHQKGLKRTASIPMYDWNILDPIWEMVEKNGTLVIVRKDS